MSITKHIREWGENRAVMVLSAVEHGGWGDLFWIVIVRSASGSFLASMAKRYRVKLVWCGCLACMVLLGEVHWRR